MKKLEIGYNRMRMEMEWEGINGMWEIGGDEGRSEE